MTLAEMREELLQGKVTSVELVQIFGRRCYYIGRAFNWTADERFGEALEEAKIKD